MQTLKQNRPREYEYIYFIHLLFVFFLVSENMLKFIYIYIYILYYAFYYISLNVSMHMDRITTYKLVYIDR